MIQDTLFPVTRCPNCGFVSVEDSERALGAAARARATDPLTSAMAARMVSTKAETMRVKLLKAHAKNPDGLTDEEAAKIAGVSLQSEYATRCSELMRYAMLIDTTQKRVSSSGALRLVRVITPVGFEVLRRRVEQEELRRRQEEL